MGSILVSGINGEGDCCDCAALPTACTDCGDACGSPTIALQCATANGTRYGFPAWDGSSRLFLILGGVLTYTGTQTCSDYYVPACMPEAATVSVALRADATWSLSQASFEDGSACSCADGTATSSASFTGYTITDVIGCENCSEALTGCLAYIALADLPIVTPCNCNGTIDPYPNCFPLAYTIASTTATILTLSAAGPTPYFAGCSGGLVDSGTMTLTLTSEYTVAEFTDEVVAKSEETLASCSDGGYLEDAFYEGARLDYEIGTTGNSPTVSTCDTLLFSYTTLTVSLSGFTGSFSWVETLYNLANVVQSTTTRTGDLGSTYTTEILPGSPNGYILVSDILVTSCTATE